MLVVEVRRYAIERAQGIVFILEFTSLDVLDAVSFMLLLPSSLAFFKIFHSISLYRLKA